MGGTGTRLWPLSRNAVPKQLLPLTSQRSMLQETLLRLRGLDNLAGPLIVCNHEHRFMVAEQLREIGVVPQDIILESCGRNTAPAVAVAALRLLAQTPTHCRLPGAEPEGEAEAAEQVTDSAMLVFPADHVIADVEAFHAAVVQATRVAQQGYLTTFGVVPGKAETGYGYIQRARRCVVLPARTRPKIQARPLLRTRPLMT